MKELLTWEEYTFLLGEIRERQFDFFNNNYLGQEQIKRYIALGHIAYELNDSGFYLYTDEGTYYRLYVQCGENKLDISKRDKPIMVRNIYLEGSKSTAQQEVESQLQDLGFSLYDEPVQMLARPFMDKGDIFAKLDRAERFLTKFGLKIIYADSSRLEEIFRFRESTPEMKPYHFLYETEEERRQAAEDGYFRCVVNAQDEICAVQQFSVEKNVIQGNWLAVKPEYQERCGVGAAIVYHSFVYAIEHNIKNIFTWVVKDNEKSMRFHKSMGYEVLDKAVAEWVLAGRKDQVE